MSTFLTTIDADHPAFHSLRSWHDQLHVHQAIMRLFPDNLATDTKQARQSAEILFRVETSHGKQRILVQAGREPLHGNTKQIDSMLKSLENDDRIVFRTRVNAVVSLARTGRRQAVPTDQIPDWLVDRLRGLDDITLNSVRVEPFTFSRGAKKVRLHTAVIDGQARVVDADAVRDLILHGLGRAKAFGCGLLSVAVL